MEEGTTEYLESRVRQRYSERGSNVALRPAPLSANKGTDIQAATCCRSTCHPRTTPSIQLNKKHIQLEQCLSSDKENAQQSLCKQHEDKLATLKMEFQKLQRTHEESLDILREENESIREQITEKQLEIQRNQAESKKLMEDYESKEMHLKEHNRKLREKLDVLESDFEQRVKGLIEENKRLRDDNDRLLSYGDDKSIGVQEVQSLRAVLELKQNEVAELRKTAAEATQKAEILVGAEERARVLNARCEDLQLQLQRKADFEKSLIQDKLKLQESFKEEINQKRRLSQHNEELQWKLKQNKEVITKVLEQAEETAFNRSILSSSFNERHSSSSRLSLERTLSFRDRTYSTRSSTSGTPDHQPCRPRKSRTSSDRDLDDLSPPASPKVTAESPASPKVKAVVEKSDSVSYVLEMDDSPDVVADRIVRRSFRQATPPKGAGTPQRGSAAGGKRPRMRTPLGQSASSTFSRNGDWEERDVFSWPVDLARYGGRLDVDSDLMLPALPSELEGSRGGLRVLPSPKLLAGEAMVSESNSEDESTSSSQL
ncbi:unnamed protein product [Phaedon cochleariae]|uniref:Uncharacterized protein n=1 Tax=Phaedon cochleariae TaxID=80249 RepID=A0A9N9SEP2_PHACE|nr:unnamed protein product [Phaedon cochleariae]